MKRTRRKRFGPLRPKRAPRPAGKRPPAIDAEQALVETAHHPAAEERVADRGHFARPSRQLVNAAQGAGTQRRSVACPVVGEKLALEPRDVHADRTLGL